MISHPQALGQCRRWLRDHGIRSIAFADTAAAVAEFAARDGPTTLAAIATDRAARIYGLPVIRSEIADRIGNVTRFVVLETEPRHYSGDEPAITSLLISIDGVVGALHRCLTAFANNGINMTKIESYQPGRLSRKTDFYIEIEGGPERPEIQRALSALADCTDRLQVIGVYRDACPERYRGR